MKAKLFLYYLRFKKPFIILAALFATVTVGIEQWHKYHHRTADYSPWTYVSVKNGNHFIVSRHNGTKDIKLCGVSPKGKLATKYLETVINQGDGTVVFERAGSAYEAWITFEPDYDVEILKKSPSGFEEGSEINIHLNTWMIEQGYAVQDLQNSHQCHEPEHLARAEDLAKEHKLGIWQDK